MADQLPRGRGRGRGRARGPAAPAPAPAAAPVPAPVVQAPAAPAPVVPAVGRGRGRGRGGAVAVAPAPAAGPVAAPADAGGRGRGVSQANAGDLASQFVGLAIGGDNGNGGGNGDNGNGAPQGRGSVRPTRECGPIMITKPSALSCKQGTEGTVVKLSSNYFELLKKKSNWSLCKHHVDVSPEEDRTHVKKRLLGQHRSKFEGYLFDGSTLFTFVNACPDGRPKELVSTYRQGTNEDGSEQMKEYVLTLKFVGTLEPTEYQYLQIFNLVLRECMDKLNLQLIRRDYYDPGAKVSVLEDDTPKVLRQNCVLCRKVRVNEFRLELWPGYSTSFIQCEQQVMLQAEIKYRVTRQDTVLEVLRDVQRDNRGGDLKTKFSNAVVGCVIMTTYNEKSYRIDEVDYNETPNSTFQQRKRGVTTNIRYADYFRERYGLSCSDMGQPMLISRSSARDRRAGQSELVYLIPEFCVFTGLTDQMRQNFQLMKRVSETTLVGPSGRIQRLRDFNRRLTGVPEVKDKLDSWSLSLAPELVKFDGRILPVEKIVVYGAAEHDAGKDANWDRILRNNQMLQGVNLDKWVVVYPRRSEREARDFCTCLSKVARGMRYTIADPKPLEIARDGPTDYVSAIRDAIDRYNPQLVMCVVPNNNSSRYGSIKRLCILEKPIPSQVVLTKNMVDKKAMSVATKVAIQMNCKVGGAPWGVHIPVKGLMTIGYDVCHDPEDKRKSYGAMVATMDTNCVRWYSNVTRHTAGEELSINFAFNVTKCVQEYRKSNNNALPAVIIIFRDGVGEGQLGQVLSIEVAKIKEALEPMYAPTGKALRMAFIVVTKRINTRIFLGENNPPPGTVVDSTITSPFKYDFFLISQSVRQGTVTPTYYNVIEDTSLLKPNHIQRLTYKFTHLYFNWSGTVRVPAPCQYAHKLAMLTAQNIMQPHSNLDRLLYFL